MASTRVERYRRLFDYEQQSHAKVLESMRRAPAAAKDTPAFQKALALLAHIAAARRIWLYRLGVASAPPAQMFPQEVRIEELAAGLEDMHAAWSKYLGGLEESELDRVFEYQSLDAGRFRNVVEDIFTQLFGHSWYHRGQIALLLRSAGAEPAVTDYIYSVREPVLARDDR
jgi:uncharacterized damage-inducible protein DinB